MIYFSEMFRKSNGKPIQHKDKNIFLMDELPVAIKKEVKLKYTIVSTNSEWRQGIAIRTDGKLIFDDVQQTKKKEWIGIWEDISLWDDVFTCYSKNGILDVKNIWDTGNGVIESWTNGAAMWYEEIPNGRRYHCNDGHFDDDFDDIVFEIMIIPNNSTVQK